MGVAAAKTRDQGGHKVSRDEPRTPLLVLPHMRELVGQELVGHLLHGQHDVTKGDRAIRPSQTRRPFSPFTYKDAFRYAAPFEEGREQKPNQRPGSRPENA